MLIERASENNAAYLRFDIKRREVLTAHVGSPLVDVIDPTAPVSASPLTVPTALDLPDVEAPTIRIPAQGKPDSKKPAATTANGSKPAASSASARSRRRLRLDLTPTQPPDARSHGGSFVWLLAPTTPRRAPHDHHDSHHR